MKKNLMLLFLLVSFCFSYSQQLGIYLMSKKGNRQTYLPENRRIKITLNNGKKIAGHFKILNQDTIIIKEVEINLDSIIKIRRASNFSTILTPISVANGSVLAIVGTILLNSGSYLASVGTVPLIYGSVFIIVPLIGKKHSSKNWNYKIEN